MKLKHIILILFWAVPCYGQFTNTVEYGPRHDNYLEKTVKLESGESDTVIVQFAPVKVAGSIFTIPTPYDGTYIDSTASDPLPYANWIARDCYFSGFLEVDLYMTNTDLAVDSLIAKCYALDRNGDLRSNDVIYLKFDTFPSYSTSAYYNAWTTATWYRASATGAFGFGTYGVAIIYNPTDETASHTGLAKTRVSAR